MHYRQQSLNASVVALGLYARSTSKILKGRAKPQRHGLRCCIWSPWLCRHWISSIMVHRSRSYKKVNTKALSAIERISLPIY